MFVNMVIRPPKNAYPALEMDVPKEAEFGGKKYKIENFQVANYNGEMLCAQFIEPAVEEERSGDTMPCIIYMHGNAGNLHEGTQYY